MSSRMLSSREHAKFLQQYPLLATIGNTPLVRVDVLEEEFPDLTVSAKLEYFNPGGSLKDRPVRQILLDALATGFYVRARLSWIPARAMPVSPMPCSVPC